MAHHRRLSALAPITLLTCLTTTLAAALPVCNPPFPNGTCATLTTPDGKPATIYLSPAFQRAASPGNGTAAGTLPARPSSDTALPPCPASFCETSTAIISGKSTNPSAPQTADCAVLQAWAAASQDHWLVPSDPQGPWAGLASTGTCAFVARAEGPFAIAAADVAALLETSIRDYSMGDRLEVLGSMPCAGAAAGECATGGGGGEKLRAEWWVVRPDMVE